MTIMSSAFYYSLSCNSFPSTMKPQDFALLPRITDLDQGCQGFVQPIVRRYSYGQIVQEFALGGNLIVRLDQNITALQDNKDRVPNTLKNLMCKEVSQHFQLWVYY